MGRTQNETIKNMNILAKRYALENQLMEAVSKGELNNADRLYEKFVSVQSPQQRASTDLRNTQNYTIILNTLLRKSAEAGKVHPLFINDLSSQFALKIEKCTTEEQLTSMGKEMVRKYCFLVKNHSMSNYSKVIQEALTLIDNDLTDNLSLSVLAEKINVNASYLSTLFKQELGQTLTEYVTAKRIEHAIYLLNSTDMQISEIAQSCGIMDVQYFSKTFKSRIGHTPSQYRTMIRQIYH